MLIPSNFGDIQCPWVVGVDPNGSSASYFDPSIPVTYHNSAALPTITRKMVIICSWHHTQDGHNYFKSGIVGIFTNFRDPFGCRKVLPQKRIYNKMGQHMDLKKD